MKVSENSFWAVIVDFLVIIVSTMGNYTLLRFITFDIFPLPYNLGQLLFIILMHGIRWKRFVSPQYVTKNKLFLLATIIYVWEILQGIFNMNIGTAGSAAIMFLFVIIDYSYLSNLYNESSRIDSVMKPYCYYAVYSYVAISVCALLLLLGVISQYDNPMPENILFSDNMENNNTDYYFPGFLSIVSSSNVLLDTEDFRLSYLLNLPIFDGFSHEPHVLNYTIIPASLLFFYVFKPSRRLTVLTILGFLIISFLATSMTAILGLLAILLVSLIYELVSKKDSVKIFILIGIVISLFFVLLTSEYFQIFQFALDSKKETSGQTAAIGFEYLYSPNKWVGNGIFVSMTKSDSTYGKQIGYISSFLVILFYLLFLFKTAKLILSKKRLFHFVGLASLYFFIHSIKLGPIALTQQYFFYFIFLMSFCESRTCSRKMELEQQM